MAKATKRIQDQLKKFASRANYTELGKEASSLIRKRTRLGFGVKNNTKQKLKELKESTVKQRKRKDLSQFTTARRSNLTETGQLLDSINVTKATDDFVEIAPTGGRKNDNQTNFEVGQYVTKGGRPFMGITEQERKQLVSFVIKKIRDLLK